MKAFDQEFTDGGSLFARLEDHRIARDERRDDVAVGQVRGEVVRPKNRHHSMRLVAQPRGALERTVELLGAGALAIGLDRDFHLADHRFDLGACFPQGLAGFARDQLGEGLGLLPYLIGKAADEFDAARVRFAGPFRQRLARLGYRSGNVADRAAPKFGSGRGFDGYDLFGHPVPTLR